jgi:hypothetical protein
MWCWLQLSWAGPADDGGALPLATPEIPEEHLYGRIDTSDGPARARLRRRRDGEFAVWELPTGTIVRYQKLDRSRVVEDHLLDAAGYPWVTLMHTGGKPTQAIIHGIPPTEHDVSTWTRQTVPGGSLLLPALPNDRSGGGVRTEVLGGQVDIWLERPIDPFEDLFRDGLVTGCGCFVIDRATTWIDGKPGVRYRLLVPGRWPRDAVDLWAVPLQGALWLMSFRVASPEDPVAALLPGRILAASAQLTGPSP